MRGMYLSGYPQTAIARKFGVSPTYVSKTICNSIVRDRVWSKLGDMERELRELRAELRAFIFSLKRP